MKKTILKISLILLCLFSMLVIFTSGYYTGVRAIQRNAIQHHVAEWVRTNDNKIEFQWVNIE